MLRYFFSVIILLLLSCNSDEIGDDFAVYFNEFKQEAYNRGVKLNYRSVTFKKQNGLIDNGVLAKATLGNNRDKTITVDSEWWESSDYNEKKAVLFHEFGHAFLCRSHYYLKISVMNEIPPREQWHSIENELLDDLFSVNDCD